MNGVRIEALAEALVAQGVRALFGVPGSGLSLQLIGALEDRRVPFVGASHEGAAAVMAGAFGRATGTLGVALSIKGPGLANMLAGIAANDFEHLPTLSISEAFAPGGSRRMHKRLDHRALTAACTKAYATLGDPADVVARLAAMAREEVPGPVHLDLFAEDVPSFEAHRVPEKRRADRRAFEAAWSMIARARRPVVIAGGVAARRSWGARLAMLSVPVFTTLAAKGVVDETLPWAAGVYTGQGKALAPERVILPHADLVVGIGLRSTEVLEQERSSAPLVLADVVGPETAIGYEPAAYVHASDAEIEDLLTLLRGRTWGEEIIRSSRAGIRNYLLRDAWGPGSALLALSESAVGDATLVSDTGLFCTVAEHLWPARSSRTFVASANGRYMGTGLPMAIGWALSASDGPVICVLGDGGIRPHIAEVKLAVARRLPICIVLMSDGRFASVGGVPGAAGAGEEATSVPRPSWHAAITALGCPAAQMHSPDGLHAFLQRWDPASGPLFVEAVFDPDAYAASIAEVR